MGNGALGGKRTLTPPPPGCGAELVGASIEVYWPLDDAWYVAEVLGFGAKDGKHKLRYVDDQVVERLYLADEKWRRRPPPPEVVAAPSLRERQRSPLAQVMPVERQTWRWLTRSRRATME